MALHSIQATLAVGALVLLVGCASVPAPDVMRAETAAFVLPKTPDAGKAMVYVVRPSFYGGFVRFNVFVGDQGAASEMGYNRASEYIYFHLPPGSHKIYSKAENWAEIALTVKAGDIAFIQQDASIGLIMARNSLTLIDDVQGKYHVKNLKAGTVLKLDK